MKRRIPIKLLDLLVYWLENCFPCAKWDGILSNVFKLEFGVRQGSVLSPFYLLSTLTIWLTFVVVIIPTLLYYTPMTSYVVGSFSLWIAAFVNCVWTSRQTSTPSLRYRLNRNYLYTWYSAGTLGAHFLPPTSLRSTGGLSNRGQLRSQAWRDTQARGLRPFVHTLSGFWEHSGGRFFYRRWPSRRPYWLPLHIARSELANAQSCSWIMCRTSW